MADVIVIALGAARRRSKPTELHCKALHLSASEERSLAERIKAGDADATEKLITANLALVLRAVKYYKRCGVPLDDLVQEGNLGLIRAARNFDPSTHTARFATYATYWIRRFIVRSLPATVHWSSFPKNHTSCGCAIAVRSASFGRSKRLWAAQSGRIHPV